MRALLNVAYTMLIDRASDRDALDDAINTSPAEQELRRKRNILQAFVEAGADVIPIAGTG